MIPKEVDLLIKKWYDNEVSEMEFLRKLSDYIKPDNINEIWNNLPRGRLRNSFYEHAKSWIEPGPRIHVGNIGPPSWWTPENWSLNQKDLIEACSQWLKSRNKALFWCTECGHLYWTTKEDIDCDGLGEHNSCCSCDIGLMNMDWDDDFNDL